MGEHGVSLENMGNMENMEPGKPTTVFFLHTFNFKAFIATVEKIITYALGEHDPGSARNWRTSNDFRSPVSQ